ncbi:MAG: hypothetical protein WC523_00390 [Patescibacteria group bacterium]
MSKRILYEIRMPIQSRVFESFVPHTDLEEMVLAPRPEEAVNTAGTYSEFGITNIQHITPYKNRKQCAQWEKELENIVKWFNPHIIASSVPDMPSFVKCKRVYVSHGLIGTDAIKITQETNMTPRVNATWSGCDLYCGAGNMFKPWLKFADRTFDEKKILLNAMPQLDLLTSDYTNKYKDKIISQTRIKNPSKVILFFGFGPYGSVDFHKHNEDYYWTIIELERLARKHNWLIMLKVKAPIDASIKFFDGYSSKWEWLAGYYSDYMKAIKSDNVYTINSSAWHIYRYLFADTIVTHGTSTVEVESCILRKPLVLVRTQVSPSEYDPFYTVNSKAAELIDTRNAELLEDTILKQMNNSDIENKRKFVEEYHGILDDKQAYSRVQQRLLEL